MFDIGFSELMVIGVVSLIVVGPKDLPGMFRTVGRYVGKAKGMAREFQRSMEDAADATGLKDVTSDFKDMASGLDDVNKMMKPGTSGVKAAKEKFDKILEAKDSGVPLKEGELESVSDEDPASDLVDDDPAPIIEIVEDAPKPTKPAEAEGSEAPAPKA